MQKFYQLAFSNCTELDYLLCQWIFSRAK
jgi:hypothetical protein